MNAKHFSAYEVTNGHHCGGVSITSWADGINTAYGKLKGIPDCEEMCNTHAECAGFVHRTSDGICSFWKQGPLNIVSKNGHNCHKKIGSNILYL